MRTRNEIWAFLDNQEDFMAEPIKLVREGQQATVYSRGEANRLVKEGWKVQTAEEAAATEAAAAEEAAAAATAQPAATTTTEGGVTVVAPPEEQGEYGVLVDQHVPAADSVVGTKANVTQPEKITDRRKG
jgi:hypothetical protein